MRTRQELYWLFVLFAFPILGSVAYFFGVYLPNSRLEHGAMKAIVSAAKAIDPTKALRLARAEYEAVPTAQNQMRLAALLLENGDAQEAAERYQALLKGPFASEPDVCFGAASALTQCQQHAQAMERLLALRQSHPHYRPDSVSYLLAWCYAGTAQPAQARQEFEQGVQKFGTFEAYAEYAIWALTTGDAPTAARLQSEIDKITSRWTAHHRTLNAAVLHRLKAAQALRSRSA